MPTADQHFDRLFDAVQDLGVKPRSMFGHRGIALVSTGKVACCLMTDELSIKLPRDSAEHAAALALKGAHVFEPMEGRQMKDWVCVPVAHAKRWEELTRAAVTSLSAG